MATTYITKGQSVSVKRIQIDKEWTNVSMMRKSNRTDPCCSMSKRQSQKATTNCQEGMKVITVTALIVMSLVSCAGADKKHVSCEEMAERLNKRWMVGANRFDAGGATGEEAQHRLAEWMKDKGILTTVCTPKGYPDVDAPCTDGFIMEHGTAFYCVTFVISIVLTLLFFLVSASWVGLTDRAKELVEADVLSPFPVFTIPGIGLVLNATAPQVDVTCSFPADGATSGRLPDGDNNHGCGPLISDYYFGSNPKRQIIERHLHDMKKNTVNLTNDMLVNNLVRRYNDSVMTWKLEDWENTGRTWEDFTCTEWIDLKFNWTGFSPKDTSSMEACKAYIEDPSNVWDEDKTTMGLLGFYEKMGAWDDVLEPILGHRTCMDSSAECVAKGRCPGFPMDWVGACSWPPENFQSSMDMWLELHSKTNPKMAQMNEVVLNMEANTLGGVEAIYVPNIESSWVGNIFNKEFLEQMDPEKYPLPLNTTAYFYYAAKKLAKEYYGGIPVVSLNPTKVSALTGTMFGCDII